MKLIYTHENKIIVENTRNYLCEKGIESVLRNEYSSGGMGELSPLETWPELWVADSDFNKGKAAIETLVGEQQGESWVCIQCKEDNDPAFETCWSCQAERT
ncbi:DUF2007 domain-containing protein [Agaribacterium sp. ZY112]|uniref:putative signal transducing protein n=1 Tax=Agaribacterium sp. ZY112 TaxID=3233574 RepID=UPI00352694AC